MGSDNDRRVLLAIALIMVLYYVWSAFLVPKAPPAEDGVEQPVAEAPAGTTTPEHPAAETSASAETSLPEVPAVSEVPLHVETLGTTTWRATLSSTTGGIGDLTLIDYHEAADTHALWTWALEKVKGQAAPGGWQAYSGGELPRRILTEEGGAFGLAGVGAPGLDGGYQVVKLSEGSWQARRTLPSGLVITKTWTTGEDPHDLQLQVSFDNRAGPAVDQVWVGVADSMRGGSGRFDNSVRPQAVIDGDIEHLRKLSDVEAEKVKDYKGPVSWFGAGDRYFMAALAPDEAITGPVVFDTLADGRTGAFLIDTQALGAGELRTYGFDGFVGPKDLDLLQHFGHDLDEAVEFGFFGFFSRVLLFLLKVAQKGVVNWGLSIIALTLLVKAVFFPLTQAAFTSSKKMQALQPHIKELQAKYKDNKELQSTETMKLFKENGVNPMGGCLPTLIQLPVWFALYGVMLNSVELYASRFMYLKDLTAPDPYGVLPVMYAVLILAQQQMMPTPGMDPTQAKMMKLMPLVFAFMMFGFPSGLVLYFCVNIALTVFQQWLINRNFNSKQLKQTAPSA